MKKQILILLCFSIALLLLFGCSQNPESDFSPFSPTGTGEVDYLITNANIVDVIGGKILPGYTLALRGQIIVDISIPLIRIINPMRPLMQMDFTLFPDSSTRMHI